MSLLIDTTNVENMTFNSQEVEKLVYNSETVWEKNSNPLVFYDYIESYPIAGNTGLVCAYMQTNYIPNWNDEYELKVDGLVTGTVACVFGSRTGNAVRHLAVALPCNGSNNQIRINFGYKYYQASTGNTIPKSSGPHVIRFNKSYAYINGTRYTYSSSSDRNTTFLQPLIIPGLNNNGTIENVGSRGVHIYYLKITRSGTLMRNFLPCKYNGEPGMWDTVEEKFYGNVYTSNPNTYLQVSND